MYFCPLQCLIWTMLTAQSLSPEKCFHIPLLCTDQKNEIQMNSGQARFCTFTNTNANCCLICKLPLLPMSHFPGTLGLFLISQ